MTRAMTRAMTRRPTASTALPALAAALALALSGCGGGGGGGPTQERDPQCPPGQTGAYPDCTPASTNGNGGGENGDGDGNGGNNGGGSTPSSPGGPAPQNPPPGDIPPTNPGGPLRGILWPNPEFDPNEPVSEDNPEQVPYPFKPAYMIPEDDPDTMDVNERETYIQEIERDADYADRTAQDIGFRIDGIREGTDTGGAVQGAPLADWTDAGMVRAIIVKARGVSGNGLDAAAVEDIEAIDGLIAELARLKAQAEMAKKALETARAGEEPRLRSLVATLRSRAATLEREIAMHEADALEKDTDADDREREIQGNDPDYDGPTIDSLTTEAEAINSEVRDLKDGVYILNAWVSHYSTDPEGTPPTDPAPDGCTDLATCRALLAPLGEITITDGGDNGTPGDPSDDPPDTIEITYGPRITVKEREETDLRDRIAALEQEVTDLRDEAQRLRGQAQEKQTKAATRGQEADSLEAEIPAALATLQAAIDTIQGHIAAIGDREDEVKTRHDADRGAANPNVPALRVQERLLALAGSDSAPAATRLVRRAGTGFEDLDRPSSPTRSATFARATPTAGITPDDALRAIVRAAQPTVDVAQFVEERMIRAPDPGTDDGSDAYNQRVDYRTLDTNLGEHWRMPLSGYLLADADFQGTALATIGTARGDSVRVTFRGVHGTVYCNGSSCGALTDATSFGSGWFFTPSLNEASGRLDAATPGSQTARFRYTANDDGTFAPLHYVDYGMWLVDGDPIDVQARAALVGPDPASRAIPNLTSRADGRNRLGFDSATYSGTAHGLSARSRYEGSEYVTASGHFTADVELNATFGGTPTLGGTIDNFRSADTANQGGGHVNPAWSLDLHGWSPASGDAAGGLGTFDDGDGNTDETARGHWSAWGHGAANARPDGFYGGFAAAFDDDGIDQAPDGANGDGSQTPDGNLFDDGAAIGVFGTTRDSQ